MEVVGSRWESLGVVGGRWESSGVVGSRGANVGSDYVKLVYSHHHHHTPPRIHHYPGRRRLGPRPFTIHLSCLEDVDELAGRGAVGL